MRIAPVSKKNFFLRFVNSKIRRKIGREVDFTYVIGHNPKILAGFLAAQKIFERATTLNPRLKQLAILRSATLIGNPFCIDIVSMFAKREGATDEQIRNLSSYQTSDAFSDVEKLCLEYADCMAQTPTDVPDRLFESLRIHFSDAELVELTMAIAWENCRARFNQAFELKSGGFANTCPDPHYQVVQNTESLSVNTG